MLLGGMKVVGIYIWVSESLFKNSTITLCQVSSYFSLAFISIEIRESPIVLMFYMSFVSHVFSLIMILLSFSD